jgi:hypothetical protein
MSDAPCALVEALADFNELKQRNAALGASTPLAGNVDVLASLDALAAAAGVRALDVAACGMVIADQVMRDVYRVGALRGGSQKSLRALIFGVWLDGCGTGLHYGTRSPARDPEPDKEA